ncbi:hypothetical protein ACLMJK_008621 [Lecanora helva]
MHCVLSVSVLIIISILSPANTSKTLSETSAASTAPKEYERTPVFHYDESTLGFFGRFLRVRYEKATGGQWSWLEMVQLLVLCGIIPGIQLWRNRRGQQEKIGLDEDSKARVGNKKWSSRLGKSSEQDAEFTDPGLLKKHSHFESFTTSYATYSSIRTFYGPHPQADKLPSIPTPLPLLVFVHGLGGSLAQFNPLLTGLVNVAPCLGIDLPGCGRSKFSPTNWDAYTIRALAELLMVVITQYCAETPHQGVVLIGHSMGCSLSALVASSMEAVRVLGLVAISPQASPPSSKQIATFERLLRIPTPIFDIWRTWDRRGGPESPSVTRLVGKDADIEVKRLQEIFNKQSRTPVWRRMAWGALPARNDGNSGRGIPGLDVWGSLMVPLFLAGGEGDSLTKVSEIAQIGKALGKNDDPESGERTQVSLSSDTELPEIALRTETALENEKRHSAASKTELTVISESLSPQNNVPSYSQTRRVLKTSILPAPASHAMLYDPATYRTLAGLIHTFLSEHVDTRLSLGWQLQHLSTEGKWDVKNLVKWQAVRPVSDPIAAIFRAMKTLREVDDVHAPESFVRNWKRKIRAVVDISHESPVYDPKGLDEGGIEYQKFPTVSKIPPTSDEARDFIKLIDRLRTSQSVTATEASGEDALIGVHCHYGFNRTGFFICCYLIEREGMGVQQAIDEFARARPPGIRHEHFLDQLFVRYCFELKRKPTL